MIENLNLKLEGKKPVSREELFILVNSWGRKFSFITNDSIKVERCQSNECYDLSNLDVSQIKNFAETFRESLYNGDLSKWDVSNSNNMKFMFFYSNFNEDISKWNISNVLNLNWMFSKNKFDGDISRWIFNKDVVCKYIFESNEFFKQKYNNNEKIPNETKDFLEWFENNRLNISNANVSKEEILNIDNYLDTFERNKELHNDK